MEGKTRRNFVCMCEFNNIQGYRMQKGCIIRDDDNPTIARCCNICTISMKVQVVEEAGRTHYAGMTRIRHS